MSEEFKLEFIQTPSGLTRADFQDEDGEHCVLKEANRGKEIWLGFTGGDRVYLNREQAKAIGFALIRFAKNGSLAEPTPEQEQLTFRERAIEALKRLKGFDLNLEQEEARRLYELNIRSLVEDFAAIKESEESR